MDAPGRPMLYVTTDKFLRVFGLNALDELPETEALSVAAAQAEGVAVENQDQITIDEDTVATVSDYTDPVDFEEENVVYENGVGSNEEVRGDVE